MTEFFDVWEQNLFPFLMLKRWGFTQLEIGNTIVAESTMLEFQVTDTMIENQQSLEAYIVHLRASLKKYKAIKVSVKSNRHRTPTQNKCIHKYCAQVSEALNDAGLDMQTVLKKGASIPWSEGKVKDDIWRQVQKAMFDKVSTTEITTTECAKVYDVVARHLSETLGVYVAWPSKESMNE